MTSRQQIDAVVSLNRQLCRDHFLLQVVAPSFEPTAPGQFVQLSCQSAEGVEEIEHTWQPGELPSFQNADLLNPRAMLRRPFSLAGRTDHPDGSVELSIIHRVVGLGTDWLSKLQPGDTVNVLGPLGNRFDLPAEQDTAILVGGGVGIPPMLYLATALAGRSAVAIVGAMSQDLLPLALSDDANYPIGEFGRLDIPSIVTTDDGSFGRKGFVTDALETLLGQHLEDRTGRQIIYTCGPEPMLKRVAEIALAHHIECQIAVERAMACGLGTCQSCCIKVKKPDPAAPPLPGSEWCWRLACTDGPIFNADQLLW